MHVCSNQQCCRSALEEHTLSAHRSGGSTGTRDSSLPEIAGGDDLFVNIGLELTFLVCICFRWALFSGSMAWLCSEHPRSVCQWLSWVHWRLFQGSPSSGCLQIPPAFAADVGRSQVTCNPIFSFLILPQFFSAHVKLFAWAFRSVSTQRGRQGGVQTDVGTKEKNLN